MQHRDKLRSHKTLDSKKKGQRIGEMYESKEYLCWRNYGFSRTGWVTYEVMHFRTLIESDEAQDVFHRNLPVMF